MIEQNQTNEIIRKSSAIFLAGLLGITACQSGGKDNPDIACAATEASRNDGRVLADVYKDGIRQVLDIYTERAGSTLNESRSNPGNFAGSLQAQLRNGNYVTLTVAASDARPTPETVYGLYVQQTTRENPQEKIMTASLDDLGDGWIFSGTYRNHEAAEVTYKATPSKFACVANNTQEQKASFMSENPAVASDIASTVFRQILLAAGASQHANPGINDSFGPPILSGEL